MPEIDTSSYPRPNQGKSVLETAGELGALKSQSLGIEQKQLDLVNQGYSYLIRELAAAGDNATPQQLDKIAQNAVKMRFVKPEMYANFVSQIPTDPRQIPAFMQNIRTRLQTTQEAINFHYGTPGAVDTGQTITPTVTSPKFGMRATGAPIQVQPPPTTPTVGPTGQPQMLGAQPPQLAPGSVSGPPPVGARSLPVGTLPPVGNIAPTAAPAPVMPPTRTPVQTLPVEPPASLDSRFGAAYGNPPMPRGPITGMPPLFEEGKKQFVEDQNLATSKMTAVTPALQALKLMPSLVASGPGTEAWNKGIALLRNIGVVSDKAADPTVAYQEVNKYLEQYVSRNGSRSDAELASKEMSNPNLRTQILPALVKLTQTTIAQDRIEAARPGAFEGNDYSKYGAHKSSFPQKMSLDAAMFDFLPENQQTKIFNEQLEKAKTGNKVAIKFIKTLDIMQKQGMH